MSPKKGFRGFNGIRTRGLCVRVAVLYHLSYEEPYNGKQANLLSSSTRERISIRRALAQVQRNVW